MFANQTRTMWLMLAVAPSAVMAAAWVVQSGHKLFEGPAALAGAIGNLCALAGLPLLIMLVVLGTRFAPVERHFGLDRLTRLHKLLGTIVVVLFTSHGLLRFVKASLVAGGDWQWLMLISFQGGDVPTWGVNLAKAALAILLVAGGLARMGDRAFAPRALPFRLWKPPHLLLYSAVILGLAHCMMTSTTMARAPYVFVWAAAAALFVRVVVERLAFVANRARTCGVTLNGSFSETADITTLRFSLPGTAGPFSRRRPGQFCVLRRTDRPWREPRPFTLSGAADTDSLQCSIKCAGNFTRELTAHTPGSTLLCEGPYGVFVPDLDRERTLVFIAGGIGATPFLSILRSLPQNWPGESVLIWNIRTQGDMFAVDELSILAQQHRLKTVCVLSRQPQLPDSQPDTPLVYERGHITAELLRRHVRPEGASWYLCGPQPMQRFVATELKKAFNVRARQIRQELFFW